MRKSIYILLMVFLLSVGIFAIKYFSKIETNSETVKASPSYLLFPSQNKKIEIELAKTSEDHVKGLMDRKYLEESRGMLFIFDDEDNRTFWMKNTYIPLDIIFVSSDMKINTIHRNTKILQTEEVYKSDLPSKYVLEVNAGFVEKNNIRTGDVIEIMDPNKDL